MEKTAFEIGFEEALKIASSGQPMVDSSPAPYLNTSGGAKAGTQGPHNGVVAPAPGSSYYSPPAAAGGHLNTNSSPSTGEKGKSETGTLAMCKDAALAIASRNRSR